MIYFIFLKIDVSEKMVLPSIQTSRAGEFTGAALNFRVCKV